MPKETLILVIALTAIQHDGTDYQLNDEFALGEKQAKPLFDVGAIKLKPVEAAAELAGEVTKIAGDAPQGAGEPVAGDAEAVATAEAEAAAAAEAEAKAAEAAAAAKAAASAKKAK